MFKLRRIKRIFSFIVVASVTLVATAATEQKNANGSGRFEFALIGDAPYGVAPGQDYPPFDALVEDVNINNKVKWVLHVGDIKAGSTPCSDEMFYDRLDRYNKFNKPVVLTPGDNEWTDCHRVKAGEFQPLERLVKLRDVFFSEPGRTVGANPMQVDTQAHINGFEEFPENVMWQHQNIIFAAMHMVGSNNGLKSFEPASSAVRTKADDNEVQRRTAAALAWMARAFEKASMQNSPGLFLMIHANPGLERTVTERYGFEEFLLALEEHVKEFKKPVVLAHGDSHYVRIDKPALVKSKFLANFTRIETFGASRVHWLRVSVDPKSDNIFSVHQEIIE